MIPPHSRDWLEFVESFNANRVEYLIVGAFAVAHHGFGSINLTERDFTESYRVVQLGFPPLRIDLITSISGVPSFEEAWKERSPGLFGGFAVSYLGKRELIINKMSIGRTKDVADVEELAGPAPHAENP